MGCVEIRSSSEETAVLIAEQAFNLQLQEAVRIDSIIRKFSTNGLINFSQFTKIAEVLQLNIKDTPQYIKIEETLKKLTIENSQYEMKDLLIIGILLGKGPSNVKAGLLFQVFDENLENKIPMKRVKDEVIAKIIDHSCKTLPNLVAAGQSLVSNTIKNEKYMSDMEQARNISINMIADKLGVSENQVSEATFVDVFSEFDRGALTSASGVRRFVYDNFVLNPIKKVFANPYKKN